MKLIKFLVKEVQEGISEFETYSFGDWEKKHPRTIKRWNYLIQGEDGKEYYLYSSKPRKFYRNKE
jgi:hypothetical protein